MTKSNKLSLALVKSPILWGALACGGFYGLIQHKPLNSELIRWIFAAHPVEYVATTMFFIGLATLAIKLVDVAQQRRGLAKPLFGPIPPGGQPVLDCEPLAKRLRQLPESQQHSYCVGRLRDALEHVRRSGSAETIDEELKYLADLDAGRMYASYGLVRMIIWAIPILGFLGTVIGITMAIGRLAPEALEASLPTVMTALGVAFYTTIQALALSIVLMFAQHFTSERENALLAQVDQRAEEELVGRFEPVESGPDGQLLAVRRMVETLIDSTEGLVRQQTDLWQASIDAAQKRWAAMADAGAEQLQAALSGALAESLQVHAREVVAAHARANEKNRQDWQQVEHALVRNTEMVGELQKAVIRKAEVLGRAVAATHQVAKLEAALNHNLEALAGAKNFEQTVMSLAAAIHLLNARLGELPSESTRVQLELDTPVQTGKAA